MDAVIKHSVKITMGYSHSRKINIPKTISYYFLITQIFTGFDFGFSKLLGENIRPFVRYFTIFVIFIYNLIFFTPAIITFSFSLLLIPLFEYILNSIALLCYKKYSVYDFLNNISEFCNLTKNEVFMINFICIINYIICFLSKTILMITIRVSGKNVEQYMDHLPSFYLVIFCLFYVIVDLVAIAQIVVFYYVYCAMKHLKIMMVSSSQKLNVTSKRYKAIVDIYEKIKPLTDSLVSNTNIFILINP